MTPSHAQHTHRGLATAFVLFLSWACTEPNRNIGATSEVAPVLEARLELSDSTARVDSEVSVTVQMRGSSPVAIGSFTARISYDSLGLRFLGETVMSDDAMRLSNPTSGLLRMAGVATTGFRDGTLFVARFIVLRPAALASLRLVVDELHTTTRVDATSALSPRGP